MCAFIPWAVFNGSGPGCLWLTSARIVRRRVQTERLTPFVSPVQPSRASIHFLWQPPLLGLSFRVLRAAGKTTFALRLFFQYLQSAMQNTLESSSASDGASLVLPWFPVWVSARTLRSENTSATWTDTIAQLLQISSSGLSHLLATRRIALFVDDADTASSPWCDILRCEDRSAPSLTVLTSCQDPTFHHGVHVVLQKPLMDELECFVKAYCDIESELAEMHASDLSFDALSQLVEEANTREQPKRKAPRYGIPNSIQPESCDPKQPTPPPKAVQKALPTTKPSQSLQERICEAFDAHGVWSVLTNPLELWLAVMAWSQIGQLERDCLLADVYEHGIFQLACRAQPQPPVGTVVDSPSGAAVISACEELAVLAVETPLLPPPNSKDGKAALLLSAPICCVETKNGPHIEYRNSCCVAFLYARQKRNSRTQIREATGSVTALIHYFEALIASRDSLPSEVLCRLEEALYKGTDGVSGVDRIAMELEARKASLDGIDIARLLHVQAQLFRRANASQRANDAMQEAIHVLQTHVHLAPKDMNAALAQMAISAADEHRTLDHLDRTRVCSAVKECVSAGVSAHNGKQKRMWAAALSVMHRIFRTIKIWKGFDTCARFDTLRCIVALHIRVHGTVGLDLAELLVELSEIASDAGEHSKAIDFLRRALAIQKGMNEKKDDGDSAIRHPSQSLARRKNWSSGGDCRVGRALLECALTEAEEVSGKGSRELAEAALALANACLALNDTKNAQDLCEQARRVIKRLPQTESSLTLNVTALAISCRVALSKHEYPQAKDYAKTALDIVGRTPSDLCSCCQQRDLLSLLAVAQASLKEPDSAETAQRVLSQCRGHNRKVFHAVTTEVRALHSTALCCLQRKDVEGAAKYLAEILRAVQSQAEVCRRSDMAERIRILDCALEIAAQVWGRGNSQYAALQLCIAEGRVSIGDYLQVVSEYLDPALSVTEGCFGSDSAQVVPILRLLAKCHEAQEQHVEAAATYGRLVAIESRVFGDSSEEVATSICAMAKARGNAGHLRQWVNTTASLLRERLRTASLSAQTFLRASRSLAFACQTVGLAAFGASLLEEAINGVGGTRALEDGGNANVILDLANAVGAAGGP